MLTEAFSEAFRLIMSADADLFEILWLSVQVSLTALLVSILLGLPIGTTLAIANFPGKMLYHGDQLIDGNAAGRRRFAGLSSLVSVRPFGVFGLLYTPSAMVIAQVLLITRSLQHSPARSWTTYKEYRDLFFSLSIPLNKAVAAYLWDARYSLITAVLAGFGRAISEVGAVMIVGGNIDHLTRVMTAIALETSRGELSVELFYWPSIIRQRISHDYAPERGTTVVRETRDSGNSICKSA